VINNYIFRIGVENTIPASKIRLKVDELVRLTELAESTKKQVDAILADFQRIGVAMLDGRAAKQVEFWGNEKARVTVTRTESLKVQYNEILRKALGKEVFDEHVTREVKYKYDNMIAGLLTVVITGEYTDDKVNDLIESAVEDAATRKALIKKLRGTNLKNDIANIEKLANMPYVEAERLADAVAQAVGGDRVQMMLTSAGYETGSDAYAGAITSIKGAAIVEENIKVALVRDKDA
jgi:hypothetical protein